MASCPVSPFLRRGRTAFEDLAINFARRGLTHHGDTTQQILTLLWYKINSPSDDETRDVPPTGEDLAYVVGLAIAGLHVTAQTSINDYEPTTPIVNAVTCAEAFAEWAEVAEDFGLPDELRRKCPRAESDESSGNSNSDDNDENDSDLGDDAESSCNDDEQRVGDIAEAEEVDDYLRANDPALDPNHPNFDPTHPDYC